MSDDLSLGERIKRARTRRRFAQEQLAEKADVSVDLVRKLDQGVRHTASMSSLTRIARAVDGDELLQAMNVSALSWVFFKQGRLDDAEAAAVRNKQADRSEEHLSLARAAAARVGKDHHLYATSFGPTNAGIAAVDAAVEGERFEHALELAEAVPTNGWVSPTFKARHLFDVAIAHSELGHDEAATAQLLAAEGIAPEWMRYHTLSRQTARELADRARRKRTPLLQLADRLNIDL
ncbi:hypothetical protein [Saccharothrix xinjiangensis]|uniref:Helix-turn-helix protein n=1 Tax=Saccharothrix xinjiangensis TaxID=204798 RepID=A0ABV9XZ32_9PSEU